MFCQSLINPMTLEDKIFHYIFSLYIIVIILAITNDTCARPLSLPAAKVKVMVSKGSKNSTIMTDLNAHLNAKPNILSPHLMQSYKQKGLMYPVFFEQLSQITLSKSRCQVMSFIDLSPYQDIFIEIGQYITTLKYDM